MIDEWFFETDRLCSPKQNHKNVRLGTSITAGTHFENSTYQIPKNLTLCKKGLQFLAWPGLRKNLKMSLMSFFLTISDEANAGNEALAEKDTVCQLCNGLKERTNDGSRFGFCKQRSLRQPWQPRRLHWQGGGWRRRQQWWPKVRNIKVNR